MNSPNEPIADDPKAAQDSAGETERSEDDVSSIFARPSYQQRPPTPRQFKPWHKPRKQLVREEVWAREIDWLLRQKPDGDKVLRYLGLPGADLLDLRYFYHRFCGAGEYTLKFLGFDESALPASQYRDALNISLQEVRSLEYVDKASQILGDNFRLLANGDSIAWQAARRLGPYDVVNVDLCDHLTNDEPALDATIYNAIYNLCTLQNRRTAPWSLLLTSRINRDSVAPTALERLMNGITRNFETCPQFLEAFQGSLGFSDVSVPSLAGLADDRFFAAIMTGLGKWMLGLSHSMSARFSISRIIGYRVYGGAPYLDMVSAVYRFEPIAVLPPDRIGLASAVPHSPSECEQALGIPAAVAGVVDIDAELRQTPLRYELFRDQMAELLLQARYDPGEYKSWADSHQN